MVLDKSLETMMIKLTPERNSEYVTLPIHESRGEKHELTFMEISIVQDLLTILGREQLFTNLFSLSYVSFTFSSFRE